MAFNPLTWFRRSEPPEQKESAAGFVVSSWHVGKPVWTTRDYENFADESYVRNAVAHRCVRLIAGGAAESMRYLLLQDARGNEIEASPMLDLLARPSPNMGGVQFFEALFSYLLLSGNSYVEAVGPERSTPRELWNLRPDRMKVIAGPYGLPKAFEYAQHGRSKRWDVDPMTGEGPILHVKEFHPTDDWYGLSRIDPAAYAVDRHNGASAHSKALLDNGARPSGALIFEAMKNGDNMHLPPDEVIAKAEKALNDRHGGAKNAGRPMVFGGNVKWEEMGISPKDMDFAQSKLDAARDICEAFGVPHILIVPGQSTYNNVREAKLALYEETVLPVIGKVVSALNAWLAPRYGDGLELSVDLDQVPALEPRREAKRASVTELLAKGVIDADEAREALQYGPRPENSVVIPNIQAEDINALVAAIEVAGTEPLLRYLKAVGLFDASKTPEQMAEDALALIEDDDDEAAAALPAPQPGEDDGQD